MFVVVIRWICGDSDTYCVVAECIEKAQEYIDVEMGENDYSGMGYYEIIEIPKYN